MSGVVYLGGVFVFPDRVENWDAPQNFELLDEKHFEVLFKNKENIDIVLLGSGEKGLFLNPVLRQSIKQKGFSVDVMDTGAACRTYNVLMAEGRRVVAMLMPI